jgi:NTP pyrophosphatase (non-canonical NTP hydrolase)
VAFREAQATVDEWIRQYKEGYFPPLTILARLTEDLALELGDILFVVVCFANGQGIDLDQAFDAVMAKIRTRDADRWTRKER